MDFFLRLSFKFNFFYQNEVTGVWRRHHFNMTNELYDNSKYLLSRLLAYIKHIDDSNDEINKILLPKIRKLLILIRKAGLIDLRELKIKTIINRFDRAFQMFINGYISYKLYFYISYGKNLF